LTGPARVALAVVHLLAAGAAATIQPAASAGGVPPGGPTAAAALRAEGLELGYNLDHRAALETFKRAIAADPEAPAGYRLAAATIWIALLFEQGVITVEDYLGQARANVARQAPTASLDAEFHEYLRQAQALAQRRLREHPSDADAHYQVGAAYGFEASYLATVQGRLAASLRPARRAYAEHSRALELDPDRKDAGLIAGTYRYAVSELSAPLRLFAYLSGFGGGRERGLRLVEDAARYPSDSQPNALFTLVLLYNRDGRYDAALDVIEQLTRRYPRNRLLRLEAGGTALRAHRPAVARAFLEQGLAQLAADPRPRASGEEARWHYAYGAALGALQERERAERELRMALAGTTRDWVRGRVHLELGKLADGGGERSRARDQYHLAAQLCGADHDSDCANDARALLTRR